MHRHACRGAPGPVFHTQDIFTKEQSTFVLLLIRTHAFCTNQGSGVHAARCMHNHKLVQATLQLYAVHIVRHRGLCRLDLYLYLGGLGDR
jgi:hypothetical protein